MAAGASSRTIGRELGTHIRIVPGLEAFNHVRDVKPGPERSEGPASKAGRKCEREPERSEGSGGNEWNPWN
jgi:hypothetical protein